MSALKYLSNIHFSLAINNPTLEDYIITNCLPNKNKYKIFFDPYLLTLVSELYPSCFSR